MTDEAGYPFLETLDHVLSVVLYRAERGEPMRLVLPNPDLIYPKRKGAGPGPDAASGARSGPTARGDGWDGSAGPGPERMEFGSAAGERFSNRMTACERAA